MNCSRYVCKIWHGMPLWCVFGVTISVPGIPKKRVNVYNSNYRIGYMQMSIYCYVNDLILY